MAEHPCPLPTPKLGRVGSLHLCECGRLYVAREDWVDAVCPTKVARWRPVRGRRWWRR